MHCVLCTIIINTTFKFAQNSLSLVQQCYERRILFLGSSNNLCISCFLHSLLLPHPLFSHSDDGGMWDLGNRVHLWNSTIMLEWPAEHTEDPGSLSTVPQCGDWVTMTSFIHAPHTPAESTLNHFCLLKVVKGSSHASQPSSHSVGDSWTLSLWVRGVSWPFSSRSCFLGWQILSIHLFVLLFLFSQKYYWAPALYHALCGVLLANGERDCQGLCHERVV